jgi:hypothetical protein
MRKLMIPALALGALTVGAMGAGNPASAAHGTAHSTQVGHLLPMGEDGDEDYARVSGGGGSGSGGSLPATGSNAPSIALIGAFALAAGGEMYRVTRRPTVQVRTETPN